jgi:hypothetical protein
MGMTEKSVEEAVEENCQAVLAGDLMRVMNDFTPEALGAVMASGGASMAAMPSLLGYRIESREPRGDDHLFRIRFTTSEGEVGVAATWRAVEGAWKIAALDIEGL